MSELNGNGHLNGKPKNKGGRPAKKVEDVLPPNWKEIIRDLSIQGKADAQIRAHFCMMGGQFSDQMWYALQKRDEEFRVTISQCKVLAESWWLDKAQSGLESKGFQTFLWFCNMKNRFGWKDKTDVEHSGTIDLTAKGILSRVQEASRVTGIPLGK